MVDNLWSDETLDALTTGRLRLSIPAGDQDASLRSGSPAAIASQEVLEADEEERTWTTRCSFERLLREDGLALTICHAHRTETVSWDRMPCW